jgi:hypothetical protein
MVSQYFLRSVSVANRHEKPGVAVTTARDFCNTGLW